MQKELTARRLTEFAEVEALYEERLKRDFARNELKPLSAIRNMWERDAYDCYGLFDGDAILGYAFFARLGRSLLFDYFAIAEGRRDEGLGSVFLQKLADCFENADLVIGEVEAPDSARDAETRALRERRLAFYLRNGCRETEVRASVFGVDYRLLVSPASKARTAAELREIYTELYRNILPRFFFRMQFRVS